MKYYTIVFPGEFGQHVQETWSEDQIIASYYKYWCGKMLENVKNPYLSKEFCIDDWCTIHWAVETDEWGNKIGQRETFEETPTEGESHSTTVENP